VIDMSARAAFVLGFFIVLAALVHAGLYVPGHDFVMNRFTGWFAFVPSEDEEWDDDSGVGNATCRALTFRIPPARFGGLHHRR
jgi:hypothetical protein